jgi:hypothetical protein
MLIDAMAYLFPCGEHGNWFYLEATGAVRGISHEMNMSRTFRESI